MLYKWQVKEVERRVMHEVEEKALLWSGTCASVTRAVKVICEDSRWTVCFGTISRRDMGKQRDPRTRKVIVHVPLQA